ncbi:MAG: hypothetical protein KDH93_06565, partial [Rhodoferax sp.]|nr:hypothetical protein [Rhodoferax sp.]
MNIDAPVAPASPTSVQKPGGAAARNRAPDDAPAAASFLSLLQAQEAAVTDPAVAADAADAVAPPGQPGADDATALPPSAELPAMPVPAAAPPAGPAPAGARSGSGAADA